MGMVWKTSNIVGLAVGLSVAFGVGTASSEPGCKIPGQGTARVCGKVKANYDRAAWKCPSFDPVSGGPRHAHFVTRDKKGKYKDGGYFVSKFNKVYTYKL